MYVINIIIIRILRNKIDTIHTHTHSLLNTFHLFAPVSLSRIFLVVLDFNVGFSFHFLVAEIKRKCRTLAAERFRCMAP